MMESVACLLQLLQMSVATQDAKAFLFTTHSLHVLPKVTLALQDTLKQ